MEIRGFNDLTRKDVFTNKGVYCGKVTDIGIDTERFRVKSIVVDAVRGSFLASIVGDKRGVVVPYAMVQSVGDIVIIKHIRPQPVEQASEEEAKQSS